MKVYARVKKQYAKAQFGTSTMGITIQQCLRIGELKAKGLIPKEFNTYKYDEYKAMILDLKAKGLIQ